VPLARLCRFYDLVGLALGLREEDLAIDKHFVMKAPV